MSEISENMNVISNNNINESFEKQLRQLDQRKIFEEAFNFIRQKTNKKTVTIGDVMCYFSIEQMSRRKFILGWTLLSMLNDRKESLLKTIPECAYNQIKEKVINDMVVE
tara:strand:+ start:34237 stop:34563 length:327 start_codon:yes stop_codon:yes gene_type:complete